MRLFRKAAVAGLVASALLPVADVRANSNILSETRTIQDCVSEKRNLDVVMLVDESSSLKGDDLRGILPNDPDDLRVDALRSIAQLLASTVDASKNESEESSGIDVKLSIAGFGEKYTTRAPIGDLNGKTLPNFVRAIDGQKDFDNDKATRYHVGLGGALDDFLDHKASDEDACRLLIWFSDGVHNDDGAGGFSSTERKQITSQLCGDGEIVDQLRTEGVYIVAAGLNSNEEELGLMRLIAAGGDSFAQIGLDKCGSIPPTGVFEQATTAEEIINKIFDVLDGVPGIPTSPVSLLKCIDGSESCNEIAFTADGTISSFTILATRPNTNIATELKMRNGQTVDLFRTPGKAPDQKNVATFFFVSDTKVLIAVSRSAGEPIDGNWALQFKGVGSADAIGAVNFVGNAQISIDEVSDAKKTLTVQRFGTKQISVNVSSKSPGASIRGVEVSLANFEGVKDLSTTRDDLDKFTVSANSLESVLRSPVLNNASSATLRVTPVGDVPGLTTIDGRPVKIEFNSETYEVLISNGESYPTFKGIKESDIRFKGVPTKTVTLLFDGPDGTDGSVEFGQLQKLKGADFEVVEAETCPVPAKSVDQECKVKIALNRNAYGDFFLTLPVKFASPTGSQDAEVVIPVKALKPTNASKGILAALELIAIFLVIQGLVRLLLSYLLSRFSQITAPTSRRVRVDAAVDSNGVLTLNPLNVNPSQSDESFTFENVEPTTSFNVFGYQFDSSMLRTFFKSTSRPVGLVSRDSFVIVGSRGCQSNKSNPQNTQGLVELSLRGQWVVGVRATDVQTLTNGQMSVPAEVVAFLDPYEQTDGTSNRAEQLSGLSFTIASSNFASEFSDILSRFRELGQLDQVDNPGSGSWDSAITEPSGNSADAFDVFGDSIGATQFESNTEVKEKSKEKRRRKGKNVKPQQESSSGSTSQSVNTDWDPFA